MIDTNQDQRTDIARTNIRLAVALRKTNFAEVARRAGLSRNALSQFVSGKTSLSYANMLAVCAVLDLPIGIIDKPDAITESKIRLYNILRQTPDHLLSEAIETINQAGRQTAQPPAKDDRSME